MPSASPPKHTNNNPRQTFPPFLISSFPGHAQTCASPLSLNPRSTNQTTPDSPASTHRVKKGGAKMELQYPTIELPDSRDRQRRSNSSGIIRQPPTSSHHVLGAEAKIEFQYPTIDVPDAENRRRSSSGTIRQPLAPTDCALYSKPAAKFELQYPSVNVPGSSPRSSTHSRETVVASFSPASSPFMSFKRSFRSRSLNAGGARLDAVDEVEEIENVNVSEQSRVGSFVRKTNVKRKKEAMLGQEERDDSGSGSTVSLESMESGG